MRTDIAVFRRLLTRCLIIGALALVAVLYYRGVCADLRRNAVTAVSLTGYQHIGPNFNIAGFYVNGYDGSNVGREGGGGSDVCCVLLPKKWRPGLVVEVRWAVGDWSKENRAEIESENYKSVTYTFFKAFVPVEKYETPEHVFVHFFRGGRARVVSSLPGPGNPDHPVLNDDMHAADIATVGQRMDAMFSMVEMQKMQHDHDNRNTFFGGWR